MAQVKCHKTDSLFGWSNSMLDEARITIMNDGQYTLKLPASKHIDELKHSENPKSELTYPVTTESAPEPLCVTIHTKELEDPDETLAKVFQYIYTIKDRIINLTIM